MVARGGVWSRGPRGDQALDHGKAGAHVARDCGGEIQGLCRLRISAECISSVFCLAEVVFFLRRCLQLMVIALSFGDIRFGMQFVSSFTRN